MVLGTRLAHKRISISLRAMWCKAIHLDDIIQLERMKHQTNWGQIMSKPDFGLVKCYGNLLPMSLSMILFSSAVISRLTHTTAVNSKNKVSDFWSSTKPGYLHGARIRCCQTKCHSVVPGCRVTLRCPHVLNVFFK